MYLPYLFVGTFMCLHTGTVGTSGFVGPKFGSPQQHVVQMIRFVEKRIFHMKRKRGKWDSLSCLSDERVLKHFVPLYLFFSSVLLPRKKKKK